MTGKRKIKKIFAFLDFIWNPDKKARILEKEIAEQRTVINGLYVRISGLERWLNEYTETLTEFTRTISAMVWHKDHLHRYKIGNELHCKTFFGIGETQECLESIVGKTDEELIDSICREAGVDNTFGEMCFVSDNHVEQTGQTCHFFEAGEIDGKQVLFYVLKTPEFDENGNFIGIIGAGWDITDQSLWVIHQLNRWIFSKKVVKLYHEKKVFAYYIRPMIKQCDIFKSVCANAMGSDQQFCNACATKGATCLHNKDLKKEINDELQTCGCDT